MRLNYEVLDIETRHQFHIARAAAPPTRRNVWVRLSDDDAVEGWGEAAPNAYYAENVETVVAALEHMRPVLEAVRSVQAGNLGNLELELLERAPRDASARAAVSAALFDLAGKRAGQPIWKLFGLNP